LARREWLSLPYELARESGSRLDPMSLLEERDHLVTGLALRQPRRRTVITPRLASIPNSFIKSVFVCFVQPSVTTWANARHIVFPGQIQSTIYPDAAFSFNLVRPHGHISNYGLVLVVTSNRIGLPLSLNLKSSVKPAGIENLGWLAAATSKLRPYDLMADDNMDADMISETPTTSATITDVFFIKCNVA